MKNFEVSFYYTYYGRMSVEATTKEEARTKVYTELEREGIGETADTIDFDNREYDVVDAEEIEEL